MAFPRRRNKNLHAYSCAGCISTHHAPSNNTGGDQLTSWINNTAKNFCSYFNTGYTGKILSMPAGGNSPGVSATYNDEISSIKAC